MGASVIQCWESVMWMNEKLSYIQHLCSTEVTLNVARKITLSEREIWVTGSRIVSAPLPAALGGSAPKKKKNIRKERWKLNVISWRRRQRIKVAVKCDKVVWWQDGRRQLLERERGNIVAHSYTIWFCCCECVWIGQIKQTNKQAKKTKTENHLQL